MAQSEADQLKDMEMQVEQTAAMAEAGAGTPANDAAQ
jgi:hypothetical protein